MVKIDDAEVTLIKSNHTKPIMEKFSASIGVSSCFVQDLSIPKQLEVQVMVPNVCAYFSPSIFIVALELISYLDDTLQKIQPAFLNSLVADPINQSIFGFSLSATLKTVTVHLDLENGEGNSTSCLLYLNATQIRIDSAEHFNCWVSTQAIQIISYHQNDKLDRCTLCMFGDVSDNSQHSMRNFVSGKINENNEKGTLVDGCFILHYEANTKKDFGPEKYTISLKDGDIHCYPYIIGLLVGFSDRIIEYARLHVEKLSDHNLDKVAPRGMSYLEEKSSDLSNLLESKSSESVSIPSSHFPSVNIPNPGHLSRLKDSLPSYHSELKNNFPMYGGRCGDVKLSKGHESNGCPPSSLKGATSGHAKFVVKLSACRIRLHFHDLSCTVGIVSLPSISTAVYIYEDFVDISCSTEGLLLNSSCWRSELELLWGPVSKEICSVLDICVWIAVTPTNPQLEVSIGIQHVRCILPTEYLAMLIGYFSLPDWNSNPKQHLHKSSSSHLDDEGLVVYKIKVVDSDLIVPTEKRSFQFLRLEIPELCSSIILDESSVILENIPCMYLIDRHKLPERSIDFNIVATQLHLSILLLKDEDNSIILDEDSEGSKLTLIAPLTADIWVRVPKESGSSANISCTPVCINARIDNFELIADDHYLFDGIDGLVTLVDQFSAIEDKSRHFTGNAMQFLHDKGCPDRNIISLANASSSMLLDISLSVDSLIIKLHYTPQDLVQSQPVAMTTMKFTCSISVGDNILQLLEARFSSFTLHSIPSTSILARCSPSSSDSIPSCTLSMSEVRNDVSFSLPSLEVWLEISDWVKILDALNSFAKKQGKSAYAGNLSNGINCTVLNAESAASENNALSTSSDSDSPGVMKHGNLVLTVRTENMGLTCHFSFPVSRDSLYNSGRDSFALSESQHLPHCKYASVTINTRSALLSLDNQSSNFKSSIEIISASLGISPEKSSRSPFFQIFQVTLEAEIYNKTANLVDIMAEIGCDHIELGFSHQVFYFWHDIDIIFPEARSSQISIGCIDCKINIRKASLLLTDGRWTCNGPLLEVLVRNFILYVKASETVVECSIASDLLINYNNIHKVMWEPFIEQWNFQIRLTRKREISILLKSSMVTDIHLKSMERLNLNVTESFFECVCRTIEMMSDALGLMKSDILSGSSSLLNPKLSETLSDGRYAPYVLQNLTSLPLSYHTFLGATDFNDFDSEEIKYWHRVQPGSSVPIYIDETPEEQLHRFKPASSSDRLNENQVNGDAHHFIVIQLEGTSIPSMPMSMDLVGLNYFLVDFSKTSSSLELETTGSSLRLSVDAGTSHAGRAGDGFVIPVVYDVSVQRFSKLIQLYSTVIVENGTSVPLELRFDIPLGLSPKILDPINPGEKVPLPLHLAESGRVRWRPQGDSYVWSETHILQNILPQDSKIGFFRSFVCYPSHPSFNRFCCCISVGKIPLHLWQNPKRGNYLRNRVKQSPGEWDNRLQLGSNNSKSRFIYQMTLSTPLVIYNYLPEVVSLTIECGGVNHCALLSEVQTSFYHIDPSHELCLSFHLQGYKISVSRIPDAEEFSRLAKFTGTKFILSETLTFDTDVGKGPINVTLEKKMDAFSGARELFIFVPFLLYNCLGFPLELADSAGEVAAETICTIPSCYDLIEQEPIEMKMDGLGLLSSAEDYSSTTKHLSANSSVISIRGMMSMPSDRVDASFLRLQRKNDKENMENLFGNNEQGKFGIFAYAPKSSSVASDNMVKVRRNLPEYVKQVGFSWSDPFPLDPASGSITVFVPQQIQNGAYVVSVTSTALSEPFRGHTRAISFQPRYIISNACSKELCYKQKGSDLVFHLGVRQHSNLHWMDTTRELLVSIRYNEPGCQWSGCFLPDILADTQVKMRNYISGALNMIRVEVQNADVSIKDEKIVASIHGNSGTNLILLSDDDSGYMPYRIENFSKERLRVYQLRCENFETIVNSYQCCPYAWDEPCLPHRLVLEVPGERILGSFALDDMMQTMTVHLPATLEKPERTLIVSARAEGATKVLSIIDSSYHVYIDSKDLSNNLTNKKRKPEQKQDNSDYNEKISISIPYIGVSLINSNSQELLFICLRGVIVNLLQNMDQQKLSCQVSSLQIDNQLPATQYPVILSFDRDSRSNSFDLEDGDQNKCWDVHIHPQSSCESVICLSMSKWRKKDMPVISFEYIIFRMAEFHLELEQEVVSSVAEFLRTVYLRLQSGVLLFSDSTEPPVLYDISLLEDPHPLVPSFNTSIRNKNTRNHSPLPSVIPIGAPWQQIYHLARRQEKIYVELFDMAYVKFTLSFSSAPWTLRFGIPTSGDSLMHRGLMALADIEGARIHLRELTISHHMASWESIREILIRHYTRQLLHEMYKVLGSAGVIGNPIGFARSLGLGIKDFLSVPTRNVLQSPVELVRDMARGTSSLLSNTVYALSDAAFQFSKAAQKGIVALTFDEQAVARMERQQRGVTSHSQGVINEVLEGLTGLLQSPIRGAEKHGLPGVLSGMALGLTGVVARPAASILEVTGKTAQSIRNRSKHYQTGGAKRLRVRLPRHLRPDLPLKPYSWDEAIGTHVLMKVVDTINTNEDYDSAASITKQDDQDEGLITCKALRQAGRFVVLSDKRILIISCPSLVDFGSPHFRGISAEPDWSAESEIWLSSVIHCDVDENVVHVMGSGSSDRLQRQGQGHHTSKGKEKWNNSLGDRTLPLFVMDLELGSVEEARQLLSTIEQRKDHRWGSGRVLHRRNIR
ncbi:hypothetical protein SAY87_006374 [Trapa incisa]|uniref:Vacuolar protein sorting-associated protein 13 VPS13 adaptor binding domain-containing protein n=1 Tax=Trapa incisa TaxID=236973 RepID=A0AAN7K0K3_9MYRT|nr:hypothetical protein SAY87_006374 [Trapa incisa]